jgi:DegV family protein with EDD domain
MQAGAIARLGGAELGRALRAGIHRLQREREYLDRINVFPVPDGDTGTNLALSMGAVLALLKRREVAHAGQLLTQVADAALDGARGNSGAILAQFFLGVGDHAGQLAELSPTDFAAAVAGGAAYAREALSAPREGTILTVLTEVGRELVRAAQGGGDDFRGLLAAGRAAAQRSLEATRAQLDVLARANVVDAGAAGFVALLEGLADYLDTGVLDESQPAAQLEAGEPDVAGSEAGLEHRWCTECSVSGAAIDRRLLRERLAAIGSSLVVAGSAAKVRVHVHTNEPARVFAIAAEFGSISGEKADDMQRQQESTLHAKRRRVAIVTDTAADIPEEELERLDIHVVPARVHFGEHSYLDKVGLTPEEFYRMLATSPVHPKTSQPPAGDFRRMFEFLSSHYAHVISLNVTGRASGTRQAAESAAARVDARERVTVIDSLNAAGGEALLVMYAAECADAGLGPDEVIARVLALRPRTRAFGYLRTLDYGVRGGRVPRWARTVARLLHIAPYLATTPDGRIAIGGFLRGRRELTRKFAEMVARRLDPGQRYRMIVSHADAPLDGQRLLEALTSRHPNIERAWLVPLGTAIGVHGGPGMLVVGLQELPAAGAFELSPGR